MNLLILAGLGSIFILGGLGSLVNSFLGDSGWHVPMFDRDSDVFRPGWLGNWLVGGLAAVASWGMANSMDLLDKNLRFQFTTAAVANALIIGFGGASWFKGQTEKTILQKTAAEAASKAADPAAASKIASSSPLEAVRTAKQMAA